MKKPRAPFKRKFIVPLYHSTVYVVVSENLKASRENMDALFGLDDWEEPTIGLCAFNKKKLLYALFLPYGASRGLVSHEAYHLTNRILDHIGATITEDHDEHGAYLNQYLTEKVYAVLDQANA